MITREQIADLQVGDVVEMTDQYLCTIRGPLREGLAGGLVLGNHTAVRYSDGGVSKPTWSLTVVSRAPRPLYVNHDREKPVPGDVVSAPVGSVDPMVYVRTTLKTWAGQDGGLYTDRQVPGERRLLIDGETGQVVP